MIYQRPVCPSCGKSLRTVERSWRNLARLLGSAVVAFFSTEIIALRWKCENCSLEFRAIGPNPIDMPRPGFPMDQERHPSQKPPACVSSVRTPPPPPRYR
jgi:hypothetical protein